MEALASPCTDKTIPHTIHVHIIGYEAIYGDVFVLLILGTIEILPDFHSRIAKHFRLLTCHGTAVLVSKIEKVFRKHKIWGIVILLKLQEAILSGCQKDVFGRIMSEEQ